MLVVLITLALNPIAASRSRRLRMRTFRTGIIVLVVLAVDGLTAWEVYRPVKKSTAQFIEQLPEYWERIQRPLMKMQQKAAVSERKIQEQVTTEIIQEDVAKTNQALATAITNGHVDPSEVGAAP